MDGRSQPIRVRRSFEANDALPFRGGFFKLGFLVKLKAGCGDVGLLGVERDLMGCVDRSSLRQRSRNGDGGGLEEGSFS